MSKTIGVCDSGIGGLVVLNALHLAYPLVDFMYIGDQLRAPYGNLDKLTLFENASEMIQAFDNVGISKVVIACNTLCANVLSELKAKFKHMELIGIIEPTMAQVSDQCKKVLVLATPKCVETRAYTQAAHNRFEVLEVACPKIVPLIESNQPIDVINQQALSYVQGLQDIDTCVMGCTHYPLVNEAVATYLGCKVVDSNQAVVDLLKDKVEEGSGKLRIYTTLDALAMKQSIQCLIHQNYEVEQIVL